MDLRDAAGRGLGQLHAVASSIVSCCQARGPGGNGWRVAKGDVLTVEVERADYSLHWLAKDGCLSDIRC